MPSTLAFANNSISRPTYLTVVLIYLGLVIVAITAAFANLRGKLRPFAAELSKPPNIEEQKRFRRSIWLLALYKLLLAF